MKATLQQALERLNPRERLLVYGCAVLLGIALVWWLAVAPALATYRQSAQNHAQLDVQLASMQSLAQEAAALKGKPRLNPVQTNAWLDAAAPKLGKATLSRQGGRVQINFTGASAPVLAAWLSDARIQASLLPVQANWKRMADAPPNKASTPNNAAPGNASSGALWEGVLIFEIAP